MIGKLVHKYRTRFGHGFRTAWYRDVIRPKLLQSSSLTVGNADRCEIHVLTSSSDYLNLVWALKSFYLASGRDYALCIHDDGSLSEAHADSLRRLFPGCRVIMRQEADAVIEQALVAYPRSLQLRRENPLAPKVFDFVHFLQSDRMLLLDSDVLFFEYPEELIRRVEDKQFSLNSVNRDVASAYTVDPRTALEVAGINLVERFNSGLGLIHRDSMCFDWIEEFLGLPGIIGHFWRIEQTLYALCSSRFGVELLPSEYDVFLNGRLGSQPSRHYVGAIRHLMYGEGIRRLVREGAILE